MRALLYENPIPWRARHHKGRGTGVYYRNAFGVEGSYAMNPRRHYRRNPSFDLMKWFSTKKIVAGAGVAAGVVLGESLTKTLGLNYEAAGPPDIAKTAIAFASTVAVGVFGGAIAEQLGQDDLGEAFVSGAYAAAVMKLAANLHVLPGILSPGSIMIGGGRAPARLLNPMPVAPAAVRSSTYIPPVYSL